MSYNCTIHGWRHLLQACPSCSAQYIVTDSTSMQSFGYKESLTKIHELEQENALLKQKLQMAIAGLQEISDKVFRKLESLK